MDEKVISAENGETKWMLMSPQQLARFHYETARRNMGEPPPLEGLRGMLKEVYNLSIPSKMLSKWMEEFKHIS